MKCKDCKHFGILKCIFGDYICESQGLHFKEEDIADDGSLESCPLKEENSTPTITADLWDYL